VFGCGSVGGFVGGLVGGSTGGLIGGFVTGGLLLTGGGVDDVDESLPPHAASCAANKIVHTAPMRRRFDKDTVIGNLLQPNQRDCGKVEIDPRPGIANIGYTRQQLLDL
jgi:hypothetical protein